MDTETTLSKVLSEFARTAVPDLPIQAILDHLVVRVVEVLPVTAAGVTLISPGAPSLYVAASDDDALRFERLQFDLGEGPCLAAYESGDAVAIPHLRDDRRFPRFTPRALEQGLEAVFTFPLRHGDEPLGALDVYRSESGPLGADAMTAAQTLACVASAYLLNARARADLDEATERARQSSLHDALTGLPNRTLLLDRLEQAITRAQRSDRLVAVFAIDLDLFKVINDAYGHHIGDELLVALAERLTGRLRASDTVSHLRGDEFIVVCEDLGDPADVDGIAARIDQALSERYVLTDTEVKVTASLGIAFAGRGDDAAEAALRDADAAMQRAKRLGGARCVVSTGLDGMGPPGTGHPALRPMLVRGSAR